MAPKKAPAPPSKPVTVNVPATASAAGGGVTPATATSPARVVTTGRGPSGRTVTTGTTVAPPRPAAPSRTDLFAGTQQLFGQQAGRIAESRGLAGGGVSETVEQPVFDPYAAYQEMLRQQQINNVISVVTALFKQYGLESLTSKIIEYARAGYQGDAIGVMLRDTPEYKARFPAMATLMSKKRAITEAEYIEYERNAAQLEKRYGLPSGLVHTYYKSLASLVRRIYRRLDGCIGVTKIILHLALEITYLNANFQIWRLKIPIGKLVAHTL